MYLSNRKVWHSGVLCRRSYSISFRVLAPVCWMLLVLSILAQKGI